jgi:hypothetical protein
MASFAISIVFSLLIIGYASASVSPYHFDATPENITAEKGTDVTFVITKNNSAVFGVNDFMTVSITKVDKDTNYFVYWHYSFHLATDKKSMSITISVPKDAVAGVYTVITTVNPYEGSIGTSIYVNESVGLNWVLIMTFEILGAVFVILCLVLYVRARKTPSIADDIGAFFGMIAGFGLIGLGIAIIFGYVVM